jgi:cobyrinic acid a,c-diamide synthase
MPILAECGGFLYLLESLTDMDGKEYKMTGIFSGKSHYTGKLSHFGYVNVIASEKNPYLCDNEIVRAHEFHYYDSSENGSDAISVKPLTDKSWESSFIGKNHWWGFAHLYYPSSPAFPKNFVQRCQEI